MTERRDMGALLRDALPAFDAPPSLETWARNQARAAEQEPAVVSQDAQSLHARRSLSLRFAQLAAMLVIGVAVGWLAATLKVAGARASSNQQLALAVVDTHVRSLLPGHLTDVLSTDQHTVKPWFIGKTDIAPPVADLSSSGFPLYGGRLDYIDGRNVAALVYHRRQHVINLFIMRRAAGESATGNFTIRGYSVRHWNAGDLSYWAVTDASSADVDAFRSAYLASLGAASRSP
jgi:anti-sigma factor RsiW